MKKQTVDCIDMGSEFCPCHLAENGQCLTCSQCQGKTFCDCLNWKGVCIYQDLMNNGGKAKDGRKIFNCSIEEIENYKNEIVKLKFKAPHKLAIDLIQPGSYVFLHFNENNYYDAPISVMDSNPDKDIITLVIEIKGIKTKQLLDYKKGDQIKIRGPYWNGVFGQRDIEKQKNGKVLIFSRGIGIAPSMPVIKRLERQGNEIQTVIDWAGIKDNFAEEFLKEHKTSITEKNIFEKGHLSDHGKVIIKDALADGVTFIHVAGADILTHLVIEYLDEIGRSDVKLSCCNNFTLCCGEGICGACTIRFAGHKVRRFCKEQVSPRELFEGRRYI